MYGPSRLPEVYGWWGGKGNGVTAVAALHRTAVMEGGSSFMKSLARLSTAIPIRSHHVPGNLMGYRAS